MTAVAEPLEAPLATLADTERAFAAAARAKGVRDAFLEFFDDAALVFTPAPENARLRLQRRPALPFSVVELTWEPRQGDVAASGELGWLTGPTTLVDHRAASPVPQFENYLSIWRRRPDGTWRVILDIAAGTPGPVAFDVGFHRFPAPSRYSGNPTEAAASLKQAERAFNDALASGSEATAWAGVAAPALRLHRNEIQPVVGRDAVIAWVRAHPGETHAAALKSEVSEAGDLGYSFGAYRQRRAGVTPVEVGSYVRVWTRNGEGRWQVAVDVTRPDE